MTFNGGSLGSVVTAFLLAFPAFFAIVNPVGSAFIFNEATAELTHRARTRVAGRVGLYSLLMLLGALWGGAYVLNFFGISLGALRVAGGVVVALRAWEMLMAPERQEARKHDQAAAEGTAGGSGGTGLEMAFFPLTMPFTTGPGSISVAITLGADRPASGQGLLAFFIGVSAAAGAIATLVWIAYRSADRVTLLLGSSARRSIARMSAFLLLCVGVQILISGVEDVVSGFVAAEHGGG